MPKPEHILVIRLSAMGDVAMTVPVIRALMNKHPNVKVTVLTRPFFAPMFRDITNTTVYAANVKNEHKGILGLYKLSKQLKRLNFDAIADLHNVLRSKLLRSFLIGIKSAHIDKGRKEKKALISGQIFHQLKSTHQRYADVFEKLGFSLDLSNPAFPEKAVLKQDIFAITGNKSNTWIGIAPFAAHASKMYPLDMMEQVIKTLSKNYKIILFGGGANEIDILKLYENKFENVISVAGKLNLEMELDLISNLDLMLSMDSGNAHLAAMLGIKVITIWGVTHPYAGFAPYNQPKDFQIISDRTQFPLIPTSVYGNKYPDEYENAAASISPDSIVAKIEKTISTNI
ncbi:glycosyltransferase family 9 protein [Geojedonia litorea]|uniref:Glycosyltransferase family 9 protein n=1 Tax=Geojedonia litorea TaxID=1268269 RepID=A0ABV9N605_9FLAO